jgi:hypothetical protein
LPFLFGVEFFFFLLLLITDFKVFSLFKLQLVTLSDKLFTSAAVLVAVLLACE